MVRLTPAAPRTLGAVAAPMADAASRQPPGYRGLATAIGLATRRRISGLFGFEDLGLRQLANFEFKRRLIARASSIPLVSLEAAVTKLPPVFGRS
jgi:hypothetical protein